MEGLVAVDQAARGDGVDQLARRRVEKRAEPGSRLGLVAGHAGLDGGGDDLPPGALVVQHVADGRLGRERAIDRRVGRLPCVGAVPDAHRLRLPGDADGRGGADRHDDVQAEAALRPFPGDLGVAVGGAMARRGPGQVAGDRRPDQQLPIAGGRRGEAGDRAVQPVGHRAEG